MTTKRMTIDEHPSEPLRAALRKHNVTYAKIEAVMARDNQRNQRSLATKAKPLTKAERDWLKRLQSVFDECPSDRLGAYTIGDPCIHIYDTRFESQINEILSSGKADFCTAADRVGAGLENITLPFPVHSTAG